MLVRRRLAALSSSFFVLSSAARLRRLLPDQFDSFLDRTDDVNPSLTTSDSSLLLLLLVLVLLRCRVDLDVVVVVVAVVGGELNPRLSEFVLERETLEFVSVVSVRSEICSYEQGGIKRGSGKELEAQKNRRGPVAERQRERKRKRKRKRENSPPFEVPDRYVVFVQKMTSSKG